jgi:hypothetical protein
MKNSYNIGNQTRDLPTCSALPQLTVPQAACPSNKLVSFSKSNPPRVRITRGAKQLDKQRWLRTAVHCEFYSTEMVPT